MFPNHPNPPVAYVTAVPTPLNDVYAPLLSAPVLLATDGSDEATGAVALGAALVRHRGAIVRAVTVLEPATFPSTGFEPAAAAAAAAAGSLSDERMEQRVRDSVLRQLSDLLGDQAAAEASFPRGRIVSTIVDEAKEAGAALIVLGLHPHDLLDRLAGEETALRVARTSAMPVLAVTPTLRRLPRRILVAVDFSRASVRAAHQVIGLAADGATVVLAHVRPPVAERDHDDANIHYSLGVGGALARLRSSLPVSPRVTVETVTLEGETSHQLQELVGRTESELVALGSHRHSFVGRLVLGSVTTDLIRRAKVSVFVVPPEERETPR